LVFCQQTLNSTTYCGAIAAARKASRRFQRAILLHDRHPAHTSKETKSWLDSKKQQVELLPPRAADMNPIENLWAILSRQVFKANTTYCSAEALTAAIQSEWAVIGKRRSVLANLANSMPWRLAEVIRKKGGCCDY
jgi:transposase